MFRNWRQWHKQQKIGDDSGHHLDPGILSDFNHCNMGGIGPWQRYALSKCDSLDFFL